MLAASFHSERVAAGRLARHDAVCPALAMERVLQTAAGTILLADFLSSRLQAREDVAQHQERRRTAMQARHLARRHASAADPAAWHAWFDGSAVPNPGRLGLGALLLAPDGRRVECSAPAGMGDSNDAEYLALILTLEQALAWQPDALVVHGDSQIVIDDVLGKKMPVPVLQAHRLHAQALLARLPSVILTWIPRARNTAADKLARAALQLPSEGNNAETQAPHDGSSV